MSSLLWGAALLPGGCATSRPYYSTSYFAQSAGQRVRPQRSRGLPRLGDPHQRAKSISIVTPEHGEQSLYPRDESSPPTIDWLPLPVLFAASYILDRKFRGEELDLYVQTAAEGYTPVSATHDLDGSVRIEMGLPRPRKSPSTPHRARAGRALWPSRRAAGEPRLAAQRAPRAGGGAVAAVPAGTDADPRHRLCAPAGRIRGVTRRSRHHIWGRYRSNSVAAAEPRDPALRYPGCAPAEPLYRRSKPALSDRHACLLHEMGHAIADYARMRVLQPTG